MQQYNNVSSSLHTYSQLVHFIYPQTQHDQQISSTSNNINQKHACIFSVNTHSTSLNKTSVCKLSPRLQMAIASSPSYQSEGTYIPMLCLTAKARQYITSYTALIVLRKAIVLNVKATARPFNASVLASLTIKSLIRATSFSWTNFSCSNFCFHEFSSSSMLDLF